MRLERPCAGRLKASLRRWVNEVEPFPISSSIIEKAANVICGAERGREAGVDSGQEVRLTSST